MSGQPGRPRIEAEALNVSVGTRLTMAEADQLYRLALASEKDISDYLRHVIRQLIATGEAVVIQRPAPEEAEWLTVSQAARIAKVSGGTIHKEIRDGRLRCVRRATKQSVRIRRAWLDNWLTGGSEGFHAATDGVVRI